MKNKDVQVGHVAFFLIKGKIQFFHCAIMSMKNIGLFVIIMKQAGKIIPFFNRFVCNCGKKNKPEVHFCKGKVRL